MSSGASSHVKRGDMGTWLKKVRYMLDGVACVISAAYHLARTRDAGHDLKLVTVMAQRDMAR